MRSISAPKFYLISILILFQTPSPAPAQLWKTLLEDFAVRVLADKQASNVDPLSVRLPAQSFEILLSLQTGAKFGSEIAEELDIDPSQFCRVSRELVRHQWITSAKLSPLSQKLAFALTNSGRELLDRYPTRAHWQKAFRERHGRSRAAWIETPSVRALIDVAAQVDTLDPLETDPYYPSSPALQVLRHLRSDLPIYLEALVGYVSGPSGRPLAAKEIYPHLLRLAQERFVAHADIEVRGRIRKVFVRTSLGSRFVEQHPDDTAFLRPGRSVNSVRSMRGASARERPDAQLSSRRSSVAYFGGGKITIGSFSYRLMAHFPRGVEGGDGSLLVIPTIRNRDPFISEQAPFFLFKLVPSPGENGFTVHGLLAPADSNWLKMFGAASPTTANWSLTIGRTEADREIDLSISGSAAAVATRRLKELPPPTGAALAPVPHLSTLVQLYAEASKRHDEQSRRGAVSCDQEFGYQFHKHEFLRGLVEPAGALALGDPRHLNYLSLHLSGMNSFIAPAR